MVFNNIKKNIEMPIDIKDKILIIDISLNKVSIVLKIENDILYMSTIKDTNMVDNECNKQCKILYNFINNMRLITKVTESDSISSLNETNKNILIEDINGNYINIFGDIYYNNIKSNNPTIAILCDEIYIKYKHKLYREEIFKN